VPVLLDGNVEEVHLRVLTRAMNERNEYLSPFAPPFAQVVPYGADADRVALLDELPVDPSLGGALLWGRSPSPLLEQISAATGNWCAAPFRCVGRPTVACRPRR
jgi:hypothetical protein